MERVQKVISNLGYASRREVEKLIDEGRILINDEVASLGAKVGSKDMGTIGIIGPKRMNYSKVISIMKYISKRLNDNNDKNEL